MILTLRPSSNNLSSLRNQSLVNSIPANKTYIISWNVDMTDTYEEAIPTIGRHFMEKVKKCLSSSLLSIWFTRAWLVIQYEKQNWIKVSLKSPEISDRDGVKISSIWISDFEVPRIKRPYQITISFPINFFSCILRPWSNEIWLRIWQINSYLLQVSKCVSLRINSMRSL